MSEKQPIKLTNLSPRQQRTLAEFVRRAATEQGGDYLSQQTMMEEILDAGFDRVFDTLKLQAEFETNQNPRRAISNHVYSR